MIEDILGMEEGELKPVLRGLSSLMEDEIGECLNTGVISYISHFAHASFRDYLFNFKSLGPIPCQSTGICKSNYYTKLCTHYAIDSPLEVNSSYDLQLVRYLQSCQDIIHHPGSTYRDLGLFYLTSSRPFQSFFKNSEGSNYDRR